MYARHRIEEWFQRIEQPNQQMRREDVCFLMVQARHLIEESSSQSRFRLVRFYADWTVHTALDRSVVCYEVLRDITQVLSLGFDQTQGNITRDISKVIGLSQLRSELLILFREHRLPLVLFEYLQNWNAFVQSLLWLLTDQSISFPDRPTGRAAEIREEMLRLKRPHNIAVESLTLVNNQNVYLWQLDVSGDKEITIAGQVELAEDSDAFSTPPQPSNASDK